VCIDVLPLLPPEEKYALEQQLRRSVQSVPANIAEAYGRYTFQEGVRFSYIARGSLEETYSHLMQSKDLEYVSDEMVSICLDHYTETARLINGYIEYLKRSKNEENNHRIEDSSLYQEYSAQFENS
jgi:four helix bundle protein